MPIEIKELHVKAVVVAEQQQPTQQEPVMTAKMKKDIAEEVFRKVMWKLRQKNER